MKDANFAPVYACVYPKIAEIARSHGYALAAHGSLARDFDLICVPWVEGVSHPQVVVDEIVGAFAFKQCGGAEQKEHGRIAYTISFDFGECRLDLSFMPAIPSASDAFDTPAEFLAHQLMAKRASILGRPLGWREAIEITAIVTNMPDDERDKLLAMDDAQPGADGTGALLEALAAGDQAAWLFLARTAGKTGVRYGTNKGMVEFLRALTDHLPTGTDSEGGTHD